MAIEVHFFCINIQNVICRLIPVCRAFVGVAGYYQTDLPIALRCIFRKYIFLQTEIQYQISEGHQSVVFYRFPEFLF